ncbi:MAG: phosphoribosylanthranilate isomerase [Prevotella sp.]|nr:phosphoribosylanthranilate isomerase [Prevotella sp.]
MNYELIKVCGMREPENIQQVTELGIDLMGFIFWPKSPRYVKSVTVKAGIVPNLPNSKVTRNAKKVKRVGVFVDEMPQTVITHAYNYRLDYIQLHGNESPVYIENLKRTLIPDILPDVKIIKALSIREADDVKRWREYENVADLLLFDTKCKCVGGSGEQFDWSVLDKYDGNIPFLLSGGIGPEDADRLKQFNHPMCIGIDLNSRFEDEPGVKNVEKLKRFIECIIHN